MSYTGEHEHHKYGPDGTCHKCEKAEPTVAAVFPDAYLDGRSDKLEIVHLCADCASALVEAL